MTLAEAFEMIERGETPEQYYKRQAKIRRLVSERIALEDCIGVLEDDPRPGDAERLAKKKARLIKVQEQLTRLTMA